MSRHPHLQPVGATLWDDAASRASDPQTSRSAASALKDGCKLVGLRLAVWCALRDMPWATAGELAERMGVERGEVSKRLPELVARGWGERGPDRPCKVKGSQMTTWYAYTKRACLMAAA